MIMEVDKDQDAVNYTCNAKNFKGEASVSTVLNILGKSTLAYISFKVL